MAGTASPVTRWVLVEHPGPWGRAAVRTARWETHAPAALEARVLAAGARLLLIRRSGRAAGDPRRRWALVDSRPGQEAVRWGSWRDELELDDVPVTAELPGGSSEPIYLVCAHARRDACCALRGRVVAAALARLRPEQTWECSHVGGDRFAANLVILPEGLFYGHVPVAALPELVAGHESGLLAPALLRGRSSLAAAVQAAQHHTRGELGDPRIGAWPPRESRQLGAGRWRVVLEDTRDGSHVEVVVRAAAAGPPARLTCHSATAEPPLGWSLESLRPAG